MKTIAVGRYEVVSELGTGGMGVVYRARDPKLDREVAVKLLRRPGQDELRRFLREAEVLSRLRHPAVVRYVVQARDREALRRK